ncbi:PAS domain S-box protein [Pseudodesulfovibrio cashew]|uniref:histidine kinase n=1 Tax=Pseudodesulfovibrio cashew TaxID=2678688 RepID=A0A6I6JCH6_9BACT|nr:PAS domain S-box protein [Pseudodesulfovibrio cashew]QGY40496.1 PAS domain S-box protein [Pseudodesulfovibrio cashew]
MNDDSKSKAQLIAELKELRSILGNGVTPVLSQDTPHRNTYKRLLDDLPQIVFEVDKDQRLVFVNREALKVFGYTLEEMEAGMTMSEIFHPDDLNRALENMRDILKGDGYFGNEYKALRKDGSIIPVKIYSRPVVQDGEPVGIRGILVDVTEAKEAEQALRESERYHRTLFNNTGTSLVIFGEDSIIRSCNDRFSLLAELPKEEIEGKMRWSDFVDPTALERMTSIHKARTMEETAPMDYEFPFMTWTKKRRTIHVFVQIIPGTANRVCSLIDVTDRKQAAEALRVSEERYELVVRGANDGIWDWNLTDDSVYFSPRYKAILGYEDQEFPNVADSWKNHIHPNDLDHVIKANLECIEGKTELFEVEYRMRHKDGSYRWILGRGTGISNEQGTISRLAGTHTDITERKLRERTTNARYAISKAMGTAPDLKHLYSEIHTILDEFIRAENFFIALHDKERDCLHFPYFVDEQDEFYVMHDVSSQKKKSLVLHILRTGEPLYFSMAHPGSQKLVEEIGVVGTTPAVWMGVPLKHKDEIIGAMAVQDYRDPLHYRESDVDLLEAASEQVALAIERKIGEEKLTRLNEELESKVEERTAELKRRTTELEAANTRLKELDKIKSSLVSSISHELRTPLTSIRGFAKLSSKDFSKHFLPLSHSPDLEKKGGRLLTNLDIIESEGERLTRLINDFLDINRIESGKATWNDTLLNPTEVVSQAAKSLSGAFAAKPAVRLEVELPERMPAVYADPDKLHQVVVNLLGNACKFTHRGKVSVSMEADRDYVRITVEDTGQGIPESSWEEIFEKFHKLGNGDTVAPQDKGTGLGLTICREIITHYGGTISVCSAEGGGSSFTFTLPVSDNG